MFSTKKEVTVNTSTAKAMHTTFLVTEWLFNSKHFFFVKQKLTFLPITKEDVFGHYRITKPLEVTLKVIFNQVPHDLKFSFKLERWEDSNEWVIRFSNILLSVDGFHSPICINERIIVDGEIEFEANGLKNQLLFQEFKETFLQDS